MAERAGIEGALDRLSEALPVGRPEVWRSLRPSVSDRDLDVLRGTIAPYALPSEVVALLQWADGQEDRASCWWPGLESGPLLSATGAAAHYAWLRDEAYPGQLQYEAILPIAHDGWWQVGVELVSGNGRTGAVIDYGFGDQPSVLAPTLSATLDLTAGMIDLGVGSPKEGDDARAWRTQRLALADQRPEWDQWPYDRVLNLAGDNWPSELLRRES